MNQSNDKIEALARSCGVPLVGVADLSRVQAYMHQEYGDAWNRYPRAVVFGLPYPREVVNQLAEGPTHTYLYYYNVLNTKLDELALRCALMLQDEGYEAFPIPASQRMGEQRLTGIFSHRLAAQLAGLGWIGKNSSLIHPLYGPRLRLVSILTNASLQTDKPIEQKCGDCRACVDACPSQAITGRAFHETDEIEKRFLGERCDEHLSRVRSAFGKRVCGKCLAACPYGKVGYDG